MRGRAILLAGLAAAAASAACFEPPVEEKIQIVFDAKGGAEVRIATRFNEAEDAAVAERLASAREEIARGEDGWSRGIRSIGPPLERREYEYREGDLTEVVRLLWVEDPETIAKLFAESPVALDLRREDRTLTLELAPTGASRATDRQEREVREGLTRFSGSVSRYVAAAADLYHHLDERPERARPCFERIFEAVIPAADRRREDLEGKEESLVHDLDEAMGSLTSVLQIGEGEAYTLDELSRLAFDPFPAELEIEVAGSLTESEGFTPLSPSKVAVRPIGLWSALQSLRGKWIEPDLVLAYVESARADEGHRLDLDAFSRQPRVVHSAPEPGEARAAIESALKPEETYRIRWTLPAGPAASEAPPP